MGVRRRPRERRQQQRTWSTTRTGSRVGKQPVAHKRHNRGRARYISPLRTATAAHAVNPSTGSPSTSSGQTGQAARTRSRVDEQPVAHESGKGKRDRSPYRLPQRERGNEVKGLVATRHFLEVHPAGRGIRIAGDSGGHSGGGTQSMRRARRIKAAAAPSPTSATVAGSGTGS